MNMWNELDLLQIRTEMEPPKEINVGLLGFILAAVGVLLGWVGGMVRTAWSLSKFDSRVVHIEIELKELKDEKVSSRLKDLEDMTDSLGGLFAIAAMADKLQQIPQIVSDTQKSVEGLNKLIFKERGGLNIITAEYCEKQQFHCGSLFKKDMDAIKQGLQQVINSTSHEALESLSKSIARLESAVTKMEK